MIHTEFCYAVNIILISRLGFVLRDEALKMRELPYLIVFQFLGLLVFQITWTSLALMALVGLMSATHFYAEDKRAKNLLDLVQIRIGFLIVYLVIFSFFFSAGMGIKFSPYLKPIAKTWGEYFVIFRWLQDLNWAELQIRMMGLLLIINEVNLFIRLYFQTFDLLPRQEESLPRLAPDSEVSVEPTRAPLDEKEYNAGRAIGILERTLIYFFVLYNDFAAIGFVIAAKSFTRFRELDKRHFAEYVLIGTLMSSTLAILVAELIKFLLKNL